MADARRGAPPGDFPHVFPSLEPPDPPAWAAWRLAALADRLDDLAFQVTLARPLRGDRYGTLRLETILVRAGAGRFDALGPMERVHLADELGEEPNPQVRALVAKALWALAIDDEALRWHLVRALASHLLDDAPLAPELLAAFPAAAASPPAEAVLVYQMLEALTQFGGARLVDHAMRDMLRTELGL